MKTFTEFLSRRDAGLLQEISPDVHEGVMGKLGGIGAMALSAMGLVPASAGAAKISYEARHNITQPAINRLAGLENARYGVRMAADGTQWHISPAGKMSRFDGAKTQETLKRLGSGYHYHTSTNTIRGPATREKPEGVVLDPLTGKPPERAVTSTTPGTELPPGIELEPAKTGKQSNTGVYGGKPTRSRP